MKLIACLVMALALPVMANQEIYDALDLVPEVAISPNGGLVAVKQTEALMCMKTVFQGETKYNCELDHEQNMQSTYEALAVEATPLPANRRTIILQKKVSNLTCTLVDALNSETSYGCRAEL